MPVAKRASKKTVAKDCPESASKPSPECAVSVKAPQEEIKSPARVETARPSHAVQPATHQHHDHSHHHVNRVDYKPNKSFVDNYELPSSYNTTSLTLIPRDPRWIYAYWDVASSSIDQARRDVGNYVDSARYVLRMHDVSSVDFDGSNANSTFDIEVGPRSNSWYVNLWNDNVSYCAELGLKYPDGNFSPLTKSNFITTPRSGPSDRSEQIWMEVKDNVTKAPYVFGSLRNRGKKRHSGLSGKRAEEYRQRRNRRLSITEDDIRAYYSKLSPLLRDVISTRFDRIYDNKKFGGGRVFVDIKGNRIALEDFLVKGLSRGQFVKRMLLGGSEEVVFLGSSESNLGGASEQAGPWDKRRKFFFEIGTELIVYGRTEPDAEVFLGTRKVDLRSDGTFTLRFALPDGKIPLDFAAISNDKVETRKITTSVSREKTRYNP